MLCMECVDLKRLDAPNSQLVSTNALISECLRKKTTKFFAQPPMFTNGNKKPQSIEYKHVSKRKHEVAPQLPIGDDVSALQPLRSSVLLVLNP